MIKLTKRISLILAFFIIAIVTVACGVLFLLAIDYSGKAGVEEYKEQEQIEFDHRYVKDNQPNFSKFKNVDAWLLFSKQDEKFYLLTPKSSNEKDTILFYSMEIDEGEQITNSVVGFNWMDEHFLANTSESIDFKQIMISEDIPNAFNTNVVSQAILGSVTPQNLVVQMDRTSTRLRLMEISTGQSEILSEGIKLQYPQTGRVSIDDLSKMNKQELYEFFDAAYQRAESYLWYYNVGIAK